MVTILALLGVLGVLLAAAFLSTREEPLLADAPRDAADVPLPDGPLSPEDVGRLRFALAPRGYRMSEVDLALERLATELADRDRRIGLLEAAAEGARPGTEVREATPADLPVTPPPAASPLPAAAAPAVSAPVAPSPAVTATPSMPAPVAPPAPPFVPAAAASPVGIPPLPATPAEVPQELAPLPAGDLGAERLSADDTASRPQSPDSGAAAAGPPEEAAAALRDDAPDAAPAERPQP